MIEKMGNFNVFGLSLKTLSSHYVEVQVLNIIIEESSINNQAKIGSVVT